MAAKDIRFGEDARSRMVKGVNILANAESGSVRKTYTVATPESVLELPLRPADTVEIKIG